MNTRHNRSGDAPSSELVPADATAPDPLALARALLNATSDAVVVTDADRRITAYNRRYAEIWGFPPGLLDSADHRAAVRAIAAKFDEPDKLIAGVDAIDASAPAQSYDVLYLTDGRSFERFSEALVIDGRPAGRVWSFRDVTDRGLADEARSRLAAIVESSDDAIISKTLEGVIVTWNTGAQRTFGYTADEIVGKSVLTLIPPDRQHEEPIILSRIRSGQRIDHYETSRVRKDGVLIDVSLTVSPVKDSSGRIIGVSKIARDISEVKRAAVERERLLAAERAARAEAERVSVVKDEFLATLSHELRTPLNAILGWVQILRSHPITDPDVNEALIVIERSTRVQTQLIDDLLDMSRIISGKLRLDVQRVDLADVIRAAVASVRHAAEARNIRLQIILDTVAGPVRGDPNRLQQCFWNLLTNAIKFTPKGGRVQVALERVNSHIEACVVDSGQGIEREFLPHVFERFRQADASTTRRHGGLGLGLSIVKNLVEFHGGTVSARSDGPGTGATFCIELPLMAADSDKAAPDRQHPRATSFASAPTEHPSLDGVTVLAVDDEPDARELLRRILEECGARVVLAASADDGLAAVRRERPDMIVSDIGMPGKDGYSFIRNVRQLSADEGGRTPAAAFTAFARAEDRMRALHAGFQTHLAKPADAAELTAVVASLATRREPT